MKKEIGVGIMGLGTVGYGTAKILQDNADVLSVRTGIDFKLVRVLDRNKEMARAKLEGLGGDASIVTADFDDFIATEGLDIVVEVIGGINAAKTLILNALHAGKSVVTANKDLMASHGKELLDAAAEKNVDLRFEASVAGGIPIIGALKTGLIGNHIKRIMGIVNGTTNFILTKMYLEGQDFLPTLKEAQDLGYAESDPTADVGGLDAARKVAILASIAYNSRVTFDDVFVEGIEKVTAADIADAKRLGYVIKLLGITKEENGAIEARVHPAMIPVQHPLAAVNDAFNAVFVEGDAVGETMFYGQGAGDLPTGSAIVSDITVAAHNIVEDTQGRGGCTCFHHKPIRKQEEFTSKFYIRMHVKDYPGVLAEIANCFGSNGVSLVSVLQEPCGGSEKGNTDLVLVTHTVSEGKFHKAKEALLQLPLVHRIDSIIRVEDGV